MLERIVKRQHLHTLTVRLDAAVNLSKQDFTLLKGSS